MVSNPISQVPQILGVAADEDAASEYYMLAQSERKCIDRFILAAATIARIQSVPMRIRWRQDAEIDDWREFVVSLQADEPDRQAQILEDLAVAYQTAMEDAQDLRDWFIGKMIFNVESSSLARLFDSARFS